MGVNLINSDTRLRGRSRFGAAKARNLTPETFLELISRAN